jgi:hypothetical protein
VSTNEDATSVGLFDPVVLGFAAARGAFGFDNAVEDVLGAVLW